MYYVRMVTCHTSSSTLRHSARKGGTPDLGLFSLISCRLSPLLFGRIVSHNFTGHLKRSMCVGYLNPHLARYFSNLFYLAPSIHHILWHHPFFINPYLSACLFRLLL
ncbi:hypothetical protein SJAG_06630 [Schizosaccharomyces japonicus yFS275]|uniref:Uncharacterized protein n=1 Tax=Schizosaccharomyces japonicus (strain yFS275 / FY16936) TaxID=402676 RepID=T0TAZ5_SCHJY|nr:hypothetical protein SJAG_06630 [Schizosaccharomyces japonicus yFS275]EQC52988.1 hypothetical protein SJAG_06630 [Schizosaccharomyces japonicus yFS275]